MPGRDLVSKECTSHPKGPVPANGCRRNGSDLDPLSDVPRRREQALNTGMQQAPHFAAAWPCSALPWSKFQPSSKDKLKAQQPLRMCPPSPFWTLLTALPIGPEPRGGLAEAGSGGPLYPSTHLLALASGGGVPI